MICFCIVLLELVELPLKIAGLNFFKGDHVHFVYNSDFWTRLIKAKWYWRIKIFLPEEFDTDRVWCRNTTRYNTCPFRVSLTLFTSGPGNRHLVQIRADVMFSGLADVIRVSESVISRLCCFRSPTMVVRAWNWSQFIALTTISHVAKINQRIPLATGLSSNGFLLQTLM